MLLCDNKRLLDKFKSWQYDDIDPDPQYGNSPTLGLPVIIQALLKGDKEYARKHVKKYRTHYQGADDDKYFGRDADLMDAMIAGDEKEVSDFILHVGGSLDIFYEFKSWSSVPPAKFEEQLLKDLSNPEITDLGQLKWVFDGAKNPSDFKKKLIAAINGLPLNELNALAQKIGLRARDGAALRKLLLDNFDSIFKLLPE